MESDTFGNLMEWGDVLDRLEDLRKTGRLDDHQKGLKRILRYRDNWKLRETVLDCIKELKAPSDGLLDEVLGIMMDDAACYDQRILAAESLGVLAAGISQKGRVRDDRAYPTRATDSMRSLMMIPQPPVFRNALERSLRLLNARGPVNTGETATEEKP